MPVPPPDAELVIVGVPPRLVCGVCGPNDHLHNLCHPRTSWWFGETWTRSWGCWHPLADHTDALRCRVCKNECGIDCRDPRDKIVRTEPATTLF